MRQTSCTLGVVCTEPTQTVHGLLRARVLPMLPLQARERAAS